MFRSSDEADAPVVGALLMVALAVILGIGMYVLFQVVLDDAESPVNAVVSTSDHNDTLTAGTSDRLVTVENRGGGGCIDLGDIRVLIEAPDRRELALSGPSDWCGGDTLTASEDGFDVPPGNYRVLVLHIPQDAVLYDRIVTVA